ncbi:MAG: hypothetical protein PHP01_07725, partial [Phycisphaerae bacterium]|nr:hypothetical protein [Phycisphaerae bacterium]
MCKKVVFLVVLSLALISTASASNDWLTSAASSDWFDPNNWDEVVVPSLTDTSNTRTYQTHMNTSYMPIIENGDAAAYQFEIGGDSQADVPGNFASVTLNGGTLTTADYFRIGASSTSNRWGKFYMNGGTVTVGDYFAIGYGNSSTDTHGWLYMTDGTINVTGDLRVASGSTCSGLGYLSGGTINVTGDLDMRHGGTVVPDGGDTPTTLLDFSGGTLILDGDETATIATYVSEGWITAYSGDGTLNYDYDTTNTGKTTITASPPLPGQASSPSPATSAANISINATLSWTAGTNATSYNVYFGTSSPGTSQGNQSGTTYDPGTLTDNTTYYWRIDTVNATGTTTGTVWSFATNTVGVVVKPDLNADGKGDLLWYRSSTGSHYGTLMNGTTKGAYSYLAGNGDGLAVVGSGDFDGNGKTDLLWYRSSTGSHYVTLMNGTTKGSYNYLGGNGDGLEIIGVGDFDANGTTDLLWYRSSTGSHYVNLMNG